MLRDEDTPVQESPPKRPSGAVRVILLVLGGGVGALFLYAAIGMAFLVEYPKDDLVAFWWPPLTCLLFSQLICFAVVQELRKRFAFSLRRAAIFAEGGVLLGAGALLLMVLISGS